MTLTIVFLCILAVLLICSIIFLPTIKIGKGRLNTYWMVALFIAILCLAFSLAPIEYVFNCFTTDTYINPFRILGLFLSMTLLAIYLDEVGFFKFLAFKASGLCKSSQLALFFILFGLTSVLTIFTSNDIVILTFTPFICYFCKRAKINPVPYLVAEFAAANTWSMMFLIGNPTNMYLANTGAINFVDYFKVMFVPTLVAGVVELGILLLLFWKKLKLPMEVTKEEYKIESKADVIVGLAHLAICLIMLIVSSYIDVEMWIISVSCAVSLTLYIFIKGIFTKKFTSLCSTYKRLPYGVIPFVLSMLVVVIAISNQHVSDELIKLLSNDAPIWTWGFSSFLVANIINNIPMSMLYASLTRCNSPAFLQTIYATVVGSNIGAFLTPIGALAGIMFTSLLAKHEVKYTFLDFIKYGAIVAIPTLAAALGMLCLFVK